MDKIEYIDTSIGTVGEADDEKSHGGGKTYPGACVPSGMVQMSPDTITGGDNGTGYSYLHNTIEGFSFNHMSGIGWYGDLGNLQLMPVTFVDGLRSGSNEETPLTKSGEGWKSLFSHDDEITKAGYYAVKLQKYNIFVEATASVRTGVLRFTYPENESAKLIMNFARRIGGRADFEEIEIINDQRIEGHIKCTPKGGGFGHGNGKITYDFYFVCEFSHPLKSTRFFSNEEYAQPELKEFRCEDAGLVADFGTLSEPLVVRCGISYVDIDGARNNLKTECETFNFDLMKQRAESLWSKALDGVQVEGENQVDLTVFHTCLYHVLLDPRTFMDCDGRFRFNGKIFENSTYTHRTVFSGWDVYRSEFPLLTLINPQMVEDELCSLLKIAEENNSSLPQWELLGINAGCMVGDPATIVMCDAALKGIYPYDIEKAYEIIKASTFCEKELFGKPFKSVRRESEQYLKDSYVPQRLSDTLEFLLADYASARLAEKLGKNEDAQRFMSRAMTYPQNYNEKLGFLAPRDESGAFVHEDDRYDDDGCVESNIFQQSWFVPYDVKGLSKLFGEQRTIDLLEEFFDKAQLSALWSDDYNHSNEPCHNITHYFSVLGLPERTQYWTRRVQKESYRLGAFGFCGNEDVGQLSAWYVLSAFGFAQLCPADEKYYLNTPLFKKAKVSLDKKYHNCNVSEELNIVCDSDPLENPYIKAVYFNGEAIKENYITYSQLTSGGTLRFELCKK